MEFADLPKAPEPERREPFLVGEVSFNECQPVQVITYDEEPTLRSEFALYDPATGQPIAEIDKLHLYITPIDSIHIPGSKSGIFADPPTGIDPKTLWRRLGIATYLADPPIIGTQTILGQAAPGRPPIETDPELTRRVREGWGVDDWTKSFSPEQRHGNWGWGLKVHHDIGEEALAKLGIRPDQLFEGTGVEMKKQREAEKQVIAGAVDLGAETYRQQKYQTGGLPGTRSAASVARSYGAPENVIRVAAKGVVKIDRWDMFEPPRAPEAITH